MEYHGPIQKVEGSDTVKIFGKEYPIFGVCTYCGQYFVTDVNKYYDSLYIIIDDLKKGVDKERHDFFDKLVSTNIPRMETLAHIEEWIEQAYIQFLDYEQRRKWFSYIAVGTSLLMFAMLNFFVKW